MKLPHVAFGPTLLALAPSASSQAYPTTVVRLDPALHATDGAAGDRLGASVAIEGDSIVAGAVGDDDNGTDAGAAYVFDAALRIQIAKLLATDGAPGDEFGHAVDVYGSLALVGAPGDDDGGSASGSAYLFDTTTGMQLHKLVAPGAAAGDRFGDAVALGPGIAVVGAWGDDTGGLDSGSVQLFDSTTGAWIRELRADDARVGDFLGIAVAIEGSTVVAGAIGVDSTVTDDGAVYVFDAVTGAQTGKLEPPPRYLQYAGTHVAVDDGLVLVGTRVTTGGIYLFDLATGERLEHFDLLYGSAIALDGGLAITDQSLRSTATGASLATIQLIDGSPNAIALSGTTIVVANRANDDLGASAGALYLFEDAPVARFRSGGSNPDSFRATPPWVDSDLTFRVDLTTTGHSHALVIGFDSPIELTLGNGTTLLCLDLGGNGELVNTGFHEGPQAVIELPVPNTTDLLGLRVCAQAIHAFGVTPFALSNAQDLVVGGCPEPSAWTHQLFAGGAGDFRDFGRSVAIDGNTLLVGSDENSAYLFDVVTGTPLHVLTPGPHAYEPFRVAVDGDTAVLGSFYDDDAGEEAGKVHLVDVPTGTFVMELFADDAAPGDQFGSAVAIGSGLVLVGALGDDDNGSSSGALYVFDANTGAQLDKIVPSDGAGGDVFGGSVAIDGSLAIVGAIGDDDGGSASGSAYVFDLTTGVQVAKLVAADGDSTDWFGSSVAIHGNTAIVGAPRDEDGVYLGGSAYVFDALSGTQLHKLRPDRNVEREQFGHAVAIHGSTALVGADSAGRAYVFDVTTGQLEQTLTPACHGDSFDTFGHSVAFDGGPFVIGVPWADEAAPNDGAVYVF